VPRAHYRDTLLGQRSDGAVIPLAGASVAVYQTGTTLPVGFPLYATAGGVAVLPNPLTADPAGAIEFWTDTDERVDLAVSAAGYAPQTVTVDTIAEGAGTGTALTAPTLTNPTLAGTVTGAPAWASPQAFAQGASVAGTGLLANAANISGGNLLFSGTAQRIAGDLSNATNANRVQVQTTTPNGTTNLGLIPNGTGTLSAVRLHNASDPDNAGQVRFFVSGTGAGVANTTIGLGTPVTTLGFTGFTGGYSFDGKVSVPGGATPVLRATAAVTSGAAAATGTLTNAPAAGNPTKWIPFDDAGTTRWIPAW
jgi:hypothetical protein